MENADSASNNLSQFITDLNIEQLNKDFAAADAKAKDLVQIKPFEYTSNNMVEPAITPQGDTKEPDNRDINQIVQDINLTEAERLNQKFVEQSKKNSFSGTNNSQPQQPFSKKDTKESSKPATPAFNAEESEKRWKDMEQRLNAVTAGLPPVPSIEEPSPKISTSKTDKKETPEPKVEQPVVREVVVTEKPSSVQSQADKPVQSSNTDNTVKLKETDKAFASALNNTFQKPSEEKADKQSSENKYTLSQGPEWETPEWAKSLIASMPPLGETVAEQTTGQGISNQGLKPFSEAEITTPPVSENKPKVERPIDRPGVADQIQSVISGVNALSPALDIFNFKAYVNQGIKEGATMRGVPGVVDMESLLKQLPFTGRPITNQPQQPPAAEEPSTPFNFNLGSVLPNFSEQRQPATMSSNTDKTLLGISQSLNKMSSSIQQSQQSLANSLNTLNNTATEILRTIPSISMQQGSTNNMASNNASNKGHFTPTENLNLIGNFRDKLGLTSRMYTNNTVFPGNNSIV